jgi:nucleotide-binding universal stress UspA family protein
MKKILVATDYSREARQALLFAMDVAFRAKAEIILFHAFNQPLSVANAFHLEEAINELEKERTKILEDYAREVKFDISKDFVLQFQSTLQADAKQKTPVNLTKTGFHILGTDPAATAVKIICVCKFGLPAETVQAAVETYGAELVIMGMRGAGPVSQAFLGSTVSGIIGAEKVPVLALPWQAAMKQRPTFVFALDLAAIPDPAMLDWLRTWVQLFNADLKVLHLYRENDPKQEQQKAIAALEALDQQLYDISYQVYFQQRPDIACGIQEFLQVQQADLLALVPKHHSFCEILFQNTITGLMTEKAIIPLLTLPYTAAGKRVPVSGNRKKKQQIS